MSGQRNGSAGRSICCPCREPRFSSQCPYRSSQLLVALVSGDPTPFSQWAPGMLVIHRHTCKQTPLHIKIKKIINVFYHPFTFFSFTCIFQTQIILSSYFGSLQFQNFMQELNCVCAPQFFMQELNCVCVYVRARAHRSSSTQQSKCLNLPKCILLYYYYSWANVTCHLCNPINKTRF